jgi:uncharacterized damage-inducible protein DinB
LTYYGPNELAASFRTVRSNTIQIAEEIPEEHYGYRVTPETRPVAETLVHIAVIPRVQEHVHFKERLTTLAGFDFFGFMDQLSAEVKKPRSKAEILELLQSEGERFAKLLESADESFLAERVEYPQGMAPPSKSRFEMLIAPKEHEMHHRGQLMMVERMLGITPHLTRRMQEVIASARAAQAAS